MIEYASDDLIERVAKWMAIHAQQNPDHGYNCACKDPQLRNARTWFTNLPEDQQREMLYVFTTLLRVNP